MKPETLAWRLLAAVMRRQGLTDLHITDQDIRDLEAEHPGEGGTVVLVESGYVEAAGGEDGYKLTLMSMAKAQAKADEVRAAMLSKAVEAPPPPNLILDPRG